MEQTTILTVVKGYQWLFEFFEVKKEEVVNPYSNPMELSSSDLKKWISLKNHNKKALYLNLIDLLNLSDEKWKMVLQEIRETSAKTLSLNLSYALPIARLEELFEAIPPNVTHLSFARGGALGRMGETATYVFCKGLMSTKINTLSLYGNDFFACSLNSFQILKEAILESTTITCLDLRHNAIGIAPHLWPELIEILKSPKINSVFLAGNHLNEIGDGNWALLATASPQIKKKFFDLSANSLEKLSACSFKSFLEFMSRSKISIFQSCGNEFGTLSEENWGLFCQTLQKLKVKELILRKNNFSLEHLRALKTALQSNLLSIDLFEDNNSQALKDEILEMIHSSKQKRNNLSSLQSLIRHNLFTQWKGSIEVENDQPYLSFNLSTHEKKKENISWDLFEYLSQYEELNSLKY